MLRLLGRATSGNVQKVVFFLNQEGIEYEREDYGRQFGNTGGDYLKMNPNGKVPTLVDDDLVVWESNTILRYLATRHDSDLYPSDAAARTHVERWMDWLLASLNFHYVTVFKGAKQSEEERDSGYAASAKEVSTQLGLLDQHLSGKKWLAGDALSLAECSLGPVVHRCLGFDIDRPGYAHLEDWQKRLLDNPAFASAVNP